MSRFNNVLIQWFTYQGNTGKQVINLPCSFSTLNYSPNVIMSQYNSGQDPVYAKHISIENTSTSAVTQNITSTVRRRYTVIGY